MAIPYASRDGTTGFTLQSVNSVFSANSGWTNSYQYAGPVDGLAAFLASIATGYTKIDIAEEGPMRIVSITYAAGETYDPDTITPSVDVISRVWTVQANQVQGPIIESDFFREFYKDSVTGEVDQTQMAEDIAYVKSLIKEYRNELETAADPSPISVFRDGLEEPIINGSPNDFLKQLFDRLVIDDEVYETSQLVIACTEELNRSSEIRGQYLYINRIMTTAFLKSIESTLDAASILAIDALEEEHGPMYWKYQAPTLTSTLGGKVEIQRSYLGYKSYDHWRYGALLTV